MMALIAYLLRSYTRSQRYFAPFAGLVIAVLVLYSYKPNPVMNSYAATAVLLFIGCAWMGLSFLNHEHSVQAQITIVHLRSARKYTAGRLITLALLTLLLDLLIVIYPLVSDRFDEPAGGYRILVALVGHGLLGMLGIAIALYLQASWVKKSSHALGILLAIIAISIGATKISSLLPAQWQLLTLLLPPVSPMMDTLMNADTLPISDVLLSFVHVFLYTAVLVALYLYLSGRKDNNKN
ncbi:hypothetical protein H1230_14990 [Paenibacillus sp. 19GGS1-52]|uniref:hypothetical protein n=1 Tax=Paenibacillus sp. 19GGS1-52 TaxID=2758563 RepID=UPI001EFADC80|nr:hypothetical protein [Paenibacillus sp. 19GGS1-52]ULO09954.1 hypothetical protein H1230_14990 [Paenibacillus sp. 19GGS1-52]